MVDIEGNRGSSAPNPYTGPGPEMPENLYMYKVKCLVYLIIGSLALRHFNFYKVILKSPHISHEWFKIGLAGTIAILSIKAYVELFEGKVKKQKINYKNFKTITHIVMVLLLLTSVAFNVALWPHYGWNTPIVLMLLFYGVIIQFLLIVPTSIQNVVALGGLTFFLQEYQ